MNRPFRVWRIMTRVMVPVLLQFRKVDPIIARTLVVLAVAFAAAEAAVAQLVPTVVVGATNQALSFPLNPYVQVLDGQYQGTHYASDSNFYFASSTHDNMHGAAFFRYQPSTGILTMLASDITVVCGENPTVTPPQGKIHTDIVETNGWLYFATDLANDWPQAEAAYTGAHVVGYQMATGIFRDFGVIRSNYTIYAGIGLDPVRNKLLVYATQDWLDSPTSYVYRVDIPTGTNECLGTVPGIAAFWFFVDSQGNCWISVQGDNGSLLEVNSATGLINRWPNVQPSNDVLGDRYWAWAQALPGATQCVFRLQSGNYLYTFDENQFLANPSNGFNIVQNIGPNGGGLVLGQNNVFYIQRADQQDGEQGYPDFHLLSVSLDPNASPAILDYGLIVDQSGRTVWRIDALAVDPQSDVYMVGDWWLLPGEQGTTTGTLRHVDGPGTNYVALDTGEFFALTTALPTNEPPPPPPPPPPGDFQLTETNDNPLAYWQLNETNGATIAADFFGNYNGSVGSGVTPGAPGPQPPAFPGFDTNNTAMQFNTSANSYLTMPTLNLNTNTVTITGWMNPSGIQSSWAGVVFCRDESDTTVAGLNFGPGPIVNELRYTWNNSGFDTGTFLSVPTNQWSFFALVVTPINATVYLGTNGTLNWFNDGVSQPSQAFDSPLLIGYDGSSSTRMFNGALDQIAIYNHSFTPAQIQQLYTSAVSPPCISNVVVYNQPANQIVVSGSTATFSVQAGATAPVYQWQDRTNSGSSWSTLAGATNASYTTSVLTTNDSGMQFHVIISGSCASPVTSSVATVTVTPALVTTSAYAQTIANDSPFAYWRLNETNGATVAHDFYNVYNGVIGPEVTAGVPGPQNPLFVGFENTNTAMQLAGASGSVLTMPALNMDTNTVTITGWIKPNGIQSGWAGVVFCRDENEASVAGLNFGPGSPANELRYTWNNSEFGVSTGLIVPTNQWSFIALVITPTNGTIYLGTSGVLNSYTDTVREAGQAFDASLYVGEDTSSGGRFYKGAIDEVAVFNHSLTFTQIQQLYTSAMNCPSFTPAAPTAVAACSGGNATFSTTPGGAAAPTYQWEKGGVAVNNGGSIGGATTATLTLTGVGTGDAGSPWSCDVMAACGTTVNSGSATLTVNPAPSIPPGHLPSVFMGIAYSQAVLASGGRAPYTYAVTSGSLPGGLTLSNSAGVISGTCHGAAGTNAFTITVTDINGCTGSQAYTVPVAACPSITLSPAGLPGGMAGNPYSQTITASGGTGPYAFSESGALPNGVTLSSGGVLSGTPTQTGTFNIAVTAIDNTTGCAGSTNDSLVINCQIVTVSISNAPVAAICAGSSLSLTAMGSSATGSLGYQWTKDGLAFATTQHITDTPAAGSHTYAVTATDTNGCSSSQASATVTVNPTPTTPTATNNGPILAGLTLNLTASTVDSATYNWTGPNGFTSTNQNPSLSNSPPATSGTYFVTVTDSNGCTSAAASTTALVTSLRITSIQLDGGDVVISWIGDGGTTNQVQMATGTTAGACSNNFTNLGTQIVLPGFGEIPTNYPDLGAATNTPVRYYRLQLVP
jgi:hypothetical protein